MPRLLPLAALALLATGCATLTSPSAPDRAALVGRWDMDRIYDGDRDVSVVQNPERDRYIALRADGSFESGGSPYGRNTGRWTYDAGARRLGLDSDLGPDDDSVWTVSLRGDVMEWRGVGSDFARRIRIVARRTR